MAVAAGGHQWAVLERAAVRCREVRKVTRDLAAGRDQPDDARCQGDGGLIPIVCSYSASKRFAVIRADGYKATTRRFSGTAFRLRDQGGSCTLSSGSGGSAIRVMCARKGASVDLPPEGPATTTPSGSPTTEAGPILPPGTRWGAQGIRCQVGPGRVACRNDDGHRFVLTAQRIVTS